MNFVRTEKSNLFDMLKPFTYIFVTGPHRAGTTISMAMIANDLDYDGYNELEWTYALQETLQPGGLVRFAESIPARSVIQCPSYCAYAHKWAGVEGLAVVLIRRKVKDIIASQVRVGWGFAAHEMAKYPGFHPPVAMAKYEYWDTVQRDILGEQAFEIAYETLAAHPKYVPKRERVDWRMNQLEIGVPRGVYIQNPELVWREE